MSVSDYLNQRLTTDPKFQEAYERLKRKGAFSWALLRARLDAQVTQEQLAAYIGTKRPAIARLEAGDRQPTVPMIQKLAAALNVSFEFLPSGEVVVHPMPKVVEEPQDAPAERTETGVSAT